MPLKFNPLTFLGFDETGNGSSGTDSDAIHKSQANEIASLTQKNTPVDDDVILIEDSADNNNKKKVRIADLPNSGGGEANTASNIGTSGVGVFEQKDGIDLQFRNIDAGSEKITVNLNSTNHVIEVDVEENNIDHDNLANFDENEHRPLNDNDVSATSLWSSDKISYELSTKSDINHTHNFTELNDTPNSYNKGRILFEGDSYVEDSGDLYWDNDNKRLGINTNTPGETFDIHANTGDASITLSSNDSGAYNTIHKFWGNNGSESKQFLFRNNQGESFEVLNNDWGKVAEFKQDYRTNFDFDGQEETTKQHSIYVGKGIYTGENKNPGTANTAGKITLISQGDNEYKTTIITGEQSSDINYTLPVNTNGSFLKQDGGTLSWTDLHESDITDLNHNDTNAIHVNQTSEINNLAEKATPVDNDILVIEDSTDSYSKKKIKISSISSGNSTTIKHVDQSGGTSDTYGVLSGAVDGVNKTYTVSAGQYTSGTLEVYLNGQLQTQGTNEDWVETDPSSGTFTFNEAPQPGDEITVVYGDDGGSGTGSGEANTASNVGVGGVGVFYQKDGVDLQFKNINAGSNRISVSDDATNHEVDIDVNESNIDHNSLLNYDADEHRKINDTGTGTTDLWSANKINNELSNKANVNHTHTESDITDLNHFDTNAIHTNRYSEINNLTEKTTVSNEDILIIEDSDNEYNKRKVKISSLPSGESNTASNVGNSGVGVFKQKTGVNLEFKNINANSTKVSIVDDTVNNNINIDINEANIKLDDLGAPDDNTDLNASTSAHGLLPKLSGNASQYLDGTGNWSTPSGGGGTNRTVNEETLTGDKTLTPGVDDVVQYLNPNGANRYITLDKTSANEGDEFIILNTSDDESENFLGIKDSDGNYLFYLSNSAKVHFVFDGSDWKLFSQENRYKIAIGDRAHVADQSGIAIGHGSGSYDNYGVAIGEFALANNNCIAIGSSAVATSESQQTAIGNHSYPQQYGEFLITGYTNGYVYRGFGNVRYYGIATNDTEKELFLLNNAGKRFVLLQKSIVRFKMWVVGMKSDYSKAAVYEFEGTVKRDDSNNTTVLGSIEKTVVYEDDAAWDANVVVDDSADAILLKTIGDSDPYTHWQATMQYTVLSI